MAIQPRQLWCSARRIALCPVQGSQSTRALVLVLIVPMNGVLRMSSHLTPIATSASILQEMRCNATLTKNRDHVGASRRAHSLKRLESNIEVGHAMLQVQCREVMRCCWHFNTFD